jgi:hypothetical protein
MGFSKVHKIFFKRFVGCSCERMLGKKDSWLGSKSNGKNVQGIDMKPL